MAAPGAASATGTMSDCRDFAEMWGVGEDSSSYDAVHQACQEGAANDPAQCGQHMQLAIWQHNHHDSQQPVPYWVGDEACRRAP